jgi:hypothetical protein
MRHIPTVPTGPTTYSAARAARHNAATLIKMNISLAPAQNRCSILPLGRNTPTPTSRCILSSRTVPGAFRPQTIGKPGQLARGRCR